MTEVYKENLKTYSPWFFFTLLYLVVDYGRPQDILPIGVLKPGMLMILILAAFVLFNGKFLKPQDIVSLANTPSKEVLLARLLGQLNMPIQSLHTLLSSPIRGLVYALNSIAQKGESK